jgi:hypothetical protein
MAIKKEQAQEVILSAMDGRCQHCRSECPVYQFQSRKTNLILDSKPHCYGVGDREQKFENLMEWVEFKAGQLHPELTLNELKKHEDWQIIKNTLDSLFPNYS